MKRLYVFIIVFVVLILIAGAGVYWYAFLRSHQDMLKTKPAYEVSSTQLINEFSADEQAAYEKYAGKVIEVTGNVVDIRTGAVQTAVILEDRLSGISVFLDSIYVADNPEKIKILDTEKDITIRGQCDGMLTDIVISRAVIIQ